MKNDDVKWIERILAGDEAAFTALVKKYEKQIHAFVRRRVKDYHAAEEITQDTFLKAYEKLGTLRDPNRFSGWLYMIATRCSLTWLGEKKVPMQSLEAMSKSEIEALFYAQYMAEQTEKLATEQQREVVAYLLQKLPAREWIDISDGLDRRLTENSGIDSLRVNRGRLFAGTWRGIYRFNAGTWEHLQLPVDNVVHVNALVGSKDQLYAAVSVNILAGDGTPEENFKQLWESEKRSWWIFRSTDGGNSWVNITPTDTSLLIGVLPQITLLTAGETLLLIGKDDGVVARSIDSGDTWTSIESSGITPMQFSVSSTAALDENTFYIGGSTGVHRSTNGGKTWHRFNTRFESRVDGLVSFMVDPAPNMPAALYARVGPNLVKSTDGGRSWDAVNIALEINRRLSKETPRIVQVVEADGMLYAKGIRGSSTAIFELSTDGNVLNPIPEIPPAFDSTKLMCHVLGGRSFNFKDERQMGQGLIITFSSTIDPLSSKLIQENPDFGAENFLKQLLQVQADSPFAYELMWEGLWGSFAVSGETFYMEYNYKLFRWNPSETKWFYTGVEETIELSRANIRSGFKIAASDGTVYVGKRDGHLWQSLDNGDTWNDITSSFPLSVEHFKEIVFAGSTVYIGTDKGVFYSKDGIVWNVLVNKTEEPVIIKSLSTTGDSVYGANDEGIYHLQGETDTWQQIAPEISGVVTSLVVDADTFYVGTERQGVLHFEYSA